VSALATYLNDHLAGATLALELARRAAPPELAEEIERDRDALEDVMARLGAGRDRVKPLLAWGAGQAARVKLRGRLSRLEQLELLRLGIDGKLALWRALEHTHPDAADFDPLIARAQSQRRRLERLRLEAAAEALSR
jgi:hypothetical protein